MEYHKKEASREHGMTCSNPECGANPVYTGKEMVHGLLSIRSKRRILNETNRENE